MKDGGLSPLQASLVVNSCGRTLLDTINMVLDWGNVKAFERDWRALRTRRASTAVGASKATRDPQSQAFLYPSLYGNVDLASIVEGVVQGAVVGQGLLGAEVDIADTSAHAHGRRLPKRSSTMSISTESLGAPVAVILDIAKAAHS